MHQLKYSLAIAAQLLFALLFGLIMIATFTEQQTIKDTARAEITPKVVELTEKNIKNAEFFLNADLGRYLLNKQQIEMAHNEIARFRENPNHYVAQLTLENSTVETSPFKAETAEQREAIENIFNWKQKIKQHFDNSFAGLMLDLRIFTATNLVVALFAAWLLCKREQLGAKAPLASIILSLLLVMFSLSYLDQHWLISVLLNSYMGYGYPLMMIAYFVYYFRKFDALAKR